MLPEQELKRTARQMNLPGFGPEQQQRLYDAHVLVIGAGGLGCPIMQTLAATGVGHITVWDDDTVDLTNIHRQILFGADDVGRRKVDVAAERLRALQPDIQVTTYFDRLTPDNFIEALDGVDLLIDGWLVIEIDGLVKYDDTTYGPAQEALLNEKKRADRIGNAGFPILRFSPSYLERHPDKFIATVRERWRRGR